MHRVKISRIFGYCLIGSAAISFLRYQLFSPNFKKSVVYQEMMISDLHGNSHVPIRHRIHNHVKEDQNTKLLTLKISELQRRAQRSMQLQGEYSFQSQEKMGYINGNGDAGRRVAYQDAKDLDEQQRSDVFPNNNKSESKRKENSYEVKFASPAPTVRIEHLKKPPTEQTKEMEKASKWREQYEFFQQDGALTSVIRNKCVDSGAGRYPGSMLRMSACSKKNRNQKFQLNNSLLVQVLKNGRSRCIEATQHRAHFHACNADKLSQKWDFRTVPSREKQFGFLVNNRYNTCLTKPPVGRQTDNKAAVVMEKCNNQCNQTWSLGQAIDIVYAENAKPQYKEPRILCWVLTYPLAASTKARAVNRTWGRKCTFLLFMTTEHVDGLETVELPVHGPEGRDKLWTKSKMAWLYVYRNYIDRADWFVKADDDTYISVDNLRRYLTTFDHTEPWQLGRLFQMRHSETRYYSGGSGIVLSQGALKALGSAMASPDDPQWAGKPNGKGPEDLLTAITLRKLGIGVQDCLDDKGRQLFLPMGIDFEYFAPKRDESSWFYNYSRNVAAGPECCSRRWATAHYIKIPDMFGLDQLEHHPCIIGTEEWPHLQLI
eukprot:m.1482870 g.1482870  ORF g.1482870 m.1482870 type:complete len:601 (-) comp25178_c0_seq74:286-2088(-)